MAAEDLGIVGEVVGIAVGEVVGIAVGEVVGIAAVVEHQVAVEEVGKELALVHNL